jgi:DNA-binding CsgD family transcriptional regulator/PAS domain-containing protein
MDSLRVAYGCHAVGFYAADMTAGAVDILGMRGIDDEQIRIYVDRHLCDNPWTRAPELQLEGVIRTERSLDEYHRRPGYYRRSILFNEWMKPQDFVHTLGVNVLCERSTQVKLFMYRAERPGAYGEQELAETRRLVAHLRHAVLVSRRLELLGARLDAALNILDRLPVGVMFLDQSGRLIQANRSAARLFEGDAVLRLHDGMIHAQRPPEDRRLARMIGAALDGQRDTRGMAATVELPRPGRRSLSAVAVPLVRHGEGRWFSSRLAAALIVSDPEGAPMLDEDWLRQRYGLTPREASLARSLVDGLSLRGAAEANGVSYETARWYLKQVFQKTGASRQGDLVRLLLSERVLVDRASAGVPSLSWHRA